MVADPSPGAVVVAKAAILTLYKQVGPNFRNLNRTR